MITADYVDKVITKTKNNIQKSLIAGKFEEALGLISICARVLYQTNIYYEDDDLENAIWKIAESLIIVDNDYSTDRDCILFYDGFGLNNRGLIQIYMKALCQIKKVVYVTYEDRKSLIPDVQDILSKYNCGIRYINRGKKSYTEQIEQLNSIVKEFSPEKLFFYSVPDDVVATPVMFAYDKLITKYQINLTDHAFWLGAKCIDKCIEFRNYGAIISDKYREIDRDKIVIIPFYPIIHREKRFQGFPFDKKENQKVIFSGGSLYKTHSEDNKYYEMVNYILDKHMDTIFWYAGGGDDSEMKKIIDKYPNRVYLTEERNDLFQVLEHVDVYLSTYPMCGGLMFQYAAMAGCVPVTLKNGNISDDFLINQENINIEFTDLRDLYSEVDKLLTDTEYAKDRSRVMKKSVISQDTFDNEVRKLVLEEGSSAFAATFGNIDTREFRQWYLDGMIKSDIDAMFVCRNYLKLGVIHYPLRFLRGGIRILQRRYL